MSFYVRGLGTAVPAHAMSQLEATSLAHEVICRSDQERKLLSVLYRKACVDNRYTALPHRIALNWLPEAEDESGQLPPTLGPSTGQRMKFYAEHAPRLAGAAAEQAITAARIDRREITHLVTVSCTGFDAPGVDTALITQLGLSPGTQRVQVGFMGCHGAINGLRVAHALTSAHAKSCVLLCAVELCSLHYRFQWDPERIIANALFADGAAAVVGTPQGGHSERDWQIRATGSWLIPDSQDAMTWSIGDHGYEMTLHARVPHLIEQHLRPWLEAWLREQGESLDSIGSWAVHPGGPRILTAVEESLGLAREATAVSREVLARHGNMSSPTVLFIVRQLLSQNAKRPCLLLGFGPGMFAEAALMG